MAVPKRLGRAGGVVEGMGVCLQLSQREMVRTCNHSQRNQGHEKNFFEHCEGKGGAVAKRVTAVIIW